MAEVLEKTLSNTVAVCAGHAANAATSATSALRAKREVNDAKDVIDRLVNTVTTKGEEIAKSVAQFEQDASTVNLLIADFHTFTEETRGELNEYVEQASQSAEQASIALNNGCVYEVRDVADATIGLDKTLTAYKHAPTGDTSYTFNAPQGAEGKIVVFWLWVVMGETAHALTFPSSVTWLSEPSFAPNTQALLAFMSVDGGATWTANVQWEA